MRAISIFTAPRVLAGVAMAVLLVLALACEDPEEQLRVTPTPGEGSPVPSAPASPETAWPAPPPEGLPPAAEGKRWWTIESSKLVGLVGSRSFTVQIPEDWLPSDPNLNSNPLSFSPPLATFPPGPVLIIQITPQAAVKAQVNGQAFRSQLPWQSGTLCGVIETGSSSDANIAKYDFMCPIEETGLCRSVESVRLECVEPTGPDSERPLDGDAEMAGYAVDITSGEFTYSLVAWEPSFAADGRALFEHVLTNWRFTE